MTLVITGREPFHSPQGLCLEEIETPGLGGRELICKPSEIRTAWALMNSGASYRAPRLAAKQTARTEQSGESGPPSNVRG